MRRALSLEATDPRGAAIAWADVDRRVADAGATLALVTPGEVELVSSHPDPPARRTRGQANRLALEASPALDQASAAGPAVQVHAVGARREAGRREEAERLARVHVLRPSQPAQKDERLPGRVFDRRLANPVAAARIALRPSRRRDEIDGHPRAVAPSVDDPADRHNLRLRIHPNIRPRPRRQDESEGNDDECCKSAGHINGYVERRSASPSELCSGAPRPH